eukprot:8635175-Alexandrium_andersonii.AAC.1
MDESGDEPEKTGGSNRTVTELRTVVEQLRPQRNRWQRLRTVGRGRGADTTNFKGRAGNPAPQG